MIEEDAGVEEPIDAGPTMPIDAGAPAPVDAGRPSVIEFDRDIVINDDEVAAIDASRLPAGSSPCRAPKLVRVEYTSDGDTINVKSPTAGEGAELERVRIIGIDAPEIAHEGSAADCFGNEARAFTRQLNGHLVWLTYESGCNDTYGRTLAHVHVASSNAGSWGRQMLRRGLARTLSVAPNRRFASQFESDEASARTTRRGLWGICE